MSLVPRAKVPCKLIEKVSLSHDTQRFCFGLPCIDQVLGLPVGKHIFVCANVDDELCMRTYTPCSSTDEVEFFRSCS